MNIWVTFSMELQIASPVTEVTVSFVYDQKLKLHKGGIQDIKLRESQWTVIERYYA